MPIWANSTSSSTATVTPFADALPVPNIEQAGAPLVLAQAGTVPVLTSNSMEKLAFVAGASRFVVKRPVPVSEAAYVWSAVKAETPCVYEVPLQVPVADPIESVAVPDVSFSSKRFEAPAFLTGRSMLFVYHVSNILGCGVPMAVGWKTRLPAGPTTGQMSPADSVLRYGPLDVPMSNWALVVVPVNVGDMVVATLGVAPEPTTMFAPAVRPVKVPVPHGAEMVVRAPPVLACTQSPDVKDVTESPATDGFVTREICGVSVPPHPVRFAPHVKL